MGKIIAVSMLILLGIGGAIRANSVSPYLFYPDSYQPVIVANNIASYGSVVGRLGPEGMIYPDYFDWTRPFFPLLISAVGLFVSDLPAAARAISFIAGLAGIFFAYKYVSAALRSKWAGIFAALFLAVSFNHAVWGGFILTDTTGVAMLLLLLWLVFRNLHDDIGLADWRDLLTGAVLALTILTRYEYALLIIPLAYLYFSSSPKAKERLVTMSASLAMVLAIVYFALSPFSVNAGNAASQLGSFFGTLGSLDVSGFVGFVIADDLIAIMFAIGVVMMVLDARKAGNASERGEILPADIPNKRTLLVFSAISLFLLGMIYYQINPGMQRYWIHLLPFMLIPSALAFERIWEWLKDPARAWPARTAGYGFMALALIWQGYFAWRGLHPLNDGLWFERGYEAEVAKAIVPSLSSMNLGPNAILLVSMPEPHSIQSGQSVYSIADAPPFIYIDRTLDERELVIVQDEGMRQIFPTFSKFLDENMQTAAFTETRVDVPYRYANEITESPRPVILYKSTVGELRSVIDAKK